MNSSNATEFGPFYYDPIDVVVKMGYTPQANTRGTMDILYSCGEDVLICRPHLISTDTKKLAGFALGLLAPEFLFVAAYNQFISARRSVRDFQACGITSWTYTHALFADAGGFMFYTPDFVPFPVNSKQILYLVHHGYLDLPIVTKKEIDDRNKRDMVLRLITLVQILWFFVDMVLRLLNRLHITALELTTMAFVSCSLVSAVFWLRKPADVRTHESLISKVPLATILIEAKGDFSTPYYYTPLDFISREEWLGSKIWVGYLNILRRTRLPGTGHPSRPIRRFQNSMVIPLLGKHAYVMTLVTGVYTGIFLFAWDHDFPTRREQQLWRAASLSVFISLPICFLLERLGHDWVPALQRRYAGLQYRQADTHEKFYSAGDRHRRRRRDPGPRFSIPYIAARVRNNTILQDPAFDVPLWINLPLYVVGCFYCGGRILLSILDLIELRLLPADAYVLPQWSALLPHF
ncbi:hypothetical protein ANO11243_083850 [Dothideomycetidae sp. 11243]|nr:hypothetical protein ANO11243_083850 [fungal sp. No.11243]